MKASRLLKSVFLTVMIFAVFASCSQERTPENDRVVLKVYSVKLDVITLRKWIDRALRKDIVVTAGVAGFEIEGGAVQELIMIDLPKNRLEAYGLVLDDIVKVTAVNGLPNNFLGVRIRQDGKIQKVDFSQYKNALAISIDSEKELAKIIRNLKRSPVKFIKGIQVELNDLATIRYGYEMSATARKQFPEKGIPVFVFKRKNFAYEKFVNNLKKRVDQLNTSKDYKGRLLIQIELDQAQGDKR